MKKLMLIATGLLASMFTLAGIHEKAVKIPEEKFQVVESSADEKPAVIVANTSLKKFKHKKMYGWTCSLVIQYKDTVQNGMPTTDEYNFVYDYLEQLNKAIKGDKKTPNALYLARITWNGTCEVIWQVKDPEAVHQYLGGIIQDKKYPRELDYRIEHDENWEQVAMYSDIP